MFIDVGSARLFFDVVGESLHAAGPIMEERPTMIYYMAVLAMTIPLFDPILTALAIHIS